MAGLEEFQRAILLTFDPGADPAQRREANASLDALKAAAEGWRFCFQAFVASEVPQVKFWCLQTLVTLVSELNGERYVALPEPQKAELRASLIAWVQARGNPRTTRRTPRSRFVSGRASLSSARTPCPPATTHAGCPALCPFGPPAHARVPPPRSLRALVPPRSPPHPASPRRLAAPPPLPTPSRRPGSSSAVCSKRPTPDSRSRAPAAPPSTPPRTPPSIPPSISGKARRTGACGVWRAHGRDAHSAPSPCAGQGCDADGRAAVHQEQVRAARGGLANPSPLAPALALACA